MKIHIQSDEMQKFPLPDVRFERGKITVRGLLVRELRAAMRGLDSSILSKKVANLTDYDKAAIAFEIITACAKREE